LYGDASEILFTDDTQISGFISLLKSGIMVKNCLYTFTFLLKPFFKNFLGAITLPSAANGYFHVSSSKDPTLGFLMNGMEVTAR